MQPPTDPENVQGLLLWTSLRLKMDALQFNANVPGILSAQWMKNARLKKFQQFPRPAG